MSCTYKDLSRGLDFKTFSEALSYELDRHFQDYKNFENAFFQHYNVIKEFIVSDNLVPDNKESFNAAIMFFNKNLMGDKDINITSKEAIKKSLAGIIGDTDLLINNDTVLGSIKNSTQVEILNLRNKLIKYFENEDHLVFSLDHVHQINSMINNIVKLDPNADMARFRSKYQDMLYKIRDNFMNEETYISNLNRAANTPTNIIPTNFNVQAATTNELATIHSFAKYHNQATLLKLAQQELAARFKADVPYTGTMIDNPITAAKVTNDMFKGFESLDKLVRNLKIATISQPYPNINGQMSSFDVFQYNMGFNMLSATHKSEMLNALNTGTTPIQSTLKALSSTSKLTVEKILNMIRVHAQNLSCSK